MKKILLIILVAIFLPLLAVQAVDENVKRGADLYLQGTTAMNQRKFLEAKEKFEAAAQYLTGKVQEDALRMADFIGKMSEEITAKDLLEDSSFSIVGEVKEEGRIWHFYTSGNEMSIMHLAIDGEKPLSDLAAAAGADLFTKEQVIKNREGYLSGELNYVPEVSSRIRMWYCDKNGTTNIVYENFPVSSPDSAIAGKAGFISDIFKEVECSYDFPTETIGGAAALIFVVIIGFIIYKKRLMINKKIIIIAVIVIILALLVLVGLFFMRSSEQTAVTLSPPASQPIKQNVQSEEEDKQETKSAKELELEQMFAATREFIKPDSAPGMEVELEVIKRFNEWVLLRIIPINIETDKAAIILEKVDGVWQPREWGTILPGWKEKVPELFES